MRNTMARAHGPLALWIRLTIAACAAAACAPVLSLAAQDRPQSGVTVYQDANYEGRSRTFTIDVPNLDASGFNDVISSITVAAGEVWELCVDSSYRGQCTTVTGDERNLKDLGWNDRISSMRRIRAGRGFTQQPGNRGGVFTGTPTLELFAGNDYSGQRKTISEAVDDFRDIDFNDRAVSVRVRGEWELCVNADFDDCRVIDANTPDLRTVGLARLVSSARPRVFGRGGNRFGAMRDGIILYSGRNFTGEALNITQARPSLGTFNDEAQSIRVLSGRWEVCALQNYRGECLVVDDDVRDLRSYDLDGEIRSVRPR